MALLTTSLDIRIPTTYKQAIKSIEKDQWIQAMQAEINELEKQHTWNLVNLPPQREALKGRWVYTIKTDSSNTITKYKARYVVKGFNQTLGLDYIDTFSTTCRPETYRVIFILALYYKWDILQYDVKNAFVHANIDTEIYIEQPIGFTKGNTVCKLLKALYGLKQAPRLWYMHLSTILKRLGFNVFPYDEATFIHHRLRIIIISYVDDFIVTGPDTKAIKEVMKKVQESIKLQELGPIKDFLGMHITKDNQSLSIDQIKYINNMLQRFNKDKLNPVSTPTDLGVQVIKYDEKATQDDITLYQQQVGSLLYLSTRTRPDIAYAVSRCSRYASNPGPIHFSALDRIWKYLIYSINYKLEYYPVNLDLLGYCDADWGSDIATRRSTTGYLFTLGKNIISWSSMLQKTVALSSCESEYMAMKDATKEAIYLNNTIIYLKDILNISTINIIPTILTDSNSAMKLAENPEFHKKSKHIDIIYHFIREAVAEKRVQIIYIPTKEQIADGLTKCLNNTKHKDYIAMLKLNIS